MHNGIYLSGTKILNTYKNRFYSFVQIPENEDDCMIWTGALSEDGYGKLRAWGRKKISAHRFSYILYFGEIPSNMSVCHKCDNPKCVKPDHLFLATHKQNMEDRDKKKRGHQFREDSQFHIGKPFKYAQFGEDSWSHKLTNLQVIEIRDQLKDGIPRHLIAKNFNINPSVISNINHGKAWKHLESNHTFPIALYDTGRKPKIRAK